MNSKYSLKQVSAGLIVSFCLALFITNISASGPRFENRDEVIHNQLAILSGNPHIIGGKTVRFPQFQARILFPILLATISKVEVLSMREWYIVLRIVTAFAAFSVFFFVSLYWTENNAYTVFLGMALLTYGLVFTFNHPWEHPSDFLDVLFYSLFLHYILSKNRIALLLIVLFATLNHQTAAFAGIIWLVLYGFSTTRNIVPKDTAVPLTFTAKPTG